MAIEDRPSVETVLGQYRACRGELFERLETQFGTREWVTFRELEVGVCGDAEPEEGQEVGLEAMGFRGKGSLAFFGHDRLGGEYHFALGSNAVFSLASGCLFRGATSRATP